MADIKISSLDPVADIDVDGTELLECTKSVGGNLASRRITAQQIADLGGGGSGGVQSIVAGANISVDDSDPENPIVSSSGGGGGIESIVAGTGIAVDTTDPQNPVVTATGSAAASDMLISNIGPGSIPLSGLSFRNSTGTTRRVTYSKGRRSGKRFFASKITRRGTSGGFSLGLVQQGSSSSQVGDAGSTGPARTGSWGVIVSGGFYTAYHGTTFDYGSISASDGDVIICYVDFDLGLIWWQINGFIPLSGSPSSGTGEAFSDIAGICYPAGSCNASSITTDAIIDFDFSNSDPFGATIESGFLPWDE